MPPDMFQRPVFARARRLCLRYPGVTEQVSWGHPNFRVAGKTFCAFEIIRKQPSIAFRLPADEVAQALGGAWPGGAVRRAPPRPRSKAQKEAEPAHPAVAAFFPTPYGRGLWVSLRVDGPVNWDLIAQLLDRSYGTVTAGRRRVAAAKRRADRML